MTFESYIENCPGQWPYEKYDAAKTLFESLHKYGIMRYLDQLYVFDTDGSMDFALSNWLNPREKCTVRDMTRTKKGFVSGGKLTQYITTPKSLFQSPKFTPDNSSVMVWVDLPKKEKAGSTPAYFGVHGLGRKYFLNSSSSKPGVEVGTGKPLHIGGSLSGLVCLEKAGKRVSIYHDGEMKIEDEVVGNTTIPDLPLILMGVNIGMGKVEKNLAGTIRFAALGKAMGEYNSTIHSLVSKYLK